MNIYFIILIIFYLNLENMKIGIICRGRTHSQAITDSLSKEYNLHNFGETYIGVNDLASRVINLRKLINKQLNPITVFEDTLKNHTDRIFSVNNFICKLWPSMLIFRNQIQKNEIYNFNQIKENVVFNLRYFWNIENYTHLYFLDKDLLHSLSSWVYSKKTTMFHTFKDSSFNTNTYSLYLNDEDINLGKLYILEYCLQQKIKMFLLKENIKFLDISNNPKDLINNDIISLVENQRNYRNLIKNYEELENLIEEWYPLCLEKTNNWNFY